MIKFKNYKWQLTISITAVGLAIAHFFKPDQIDNLIILLALLAISPWALPYLSKYIKSIEAFGAKLELLENRIEDESQRLDDLYFLSIGEKLLNHMRKLGQPGGYGRFYVGTALPRELEQLENLGYIHFQGGLEGLDDFQNKFNSKEGANLSDYIELTDTGRLFLKLRDQSQKKRIRR